ncbi:hypothetical protein HIM_02962 [Hirsutella minnesotensis 3608]|nr:hypothetical protein HIM_02962 [Hirsutella minnesotensis 3608]
MCSSDIFLGLLAILFPPLPVWIKCGICSADSVINILLCVLGFIPGLIHAWYIIAKYPEPSCDYDALPQDQEAGRVTYVYVQSPARCGGAPQPPPHGAMNYGTQGNAQPSSQQQQGVAPAAASSSNNQQRAVPPSYAEVVAGDHKIQTRD